jgi:aryl-alcohol dehydrogenase-like predicted oxidoreductase
LIEPGGRIDASRFGAPAARAQTELNAPLALNWARKTPFNITAPIITSSSAAKILAVLQNTSSRL